MYVPNEVRPTFFWSQSEMQFVKTEEKIEKLPSLPYAWLKFEAVN